MLLLNIKKSNIL